FQEPPATRLLSYTQNTLIVRMVCRNIVGHAEKSKVHTVSELAWSGRRKRMQSERWRIDLLGELRATFGFQTITRFYTHKIGGLLAFLAFYQGRTHPREELIERFWPHTDIEQGRMSLRTALASLRKQLELPGMTPGSVLLADRSTVSLSSEAITVDV